MARKYLITRKLIDRYCKDGENQDFAVKILKRDTWLNYDNANQILRACSKDPNFKEKVLKAPRNYAEIFHIRNKSFLKNYGFSLSNDPSKIVGRFCGCYAAYVNKNKIHLSTGYDFDTAYCSLFMSIEGSFSNLYSTIANLYGFNIPDGYKWYNVPKTKLARYLSKDLQSTLPTVLKVVDVADIT